MELGPMHWSYIIVLQENEQKNGKGSKNKIIKNREYYLELGMNILMGNERIFNVTCDFSNTTKTLEKFGSDFAPNLFVQFKAKQCHFHWMKRI